MEEEMEAAQGGDKGNASGEMAESKRSSEKTSGKGEYIEREPK